MQSPSILVCIKENINILMIAVEIRQYFLLLWNITLLQNLKQLFNHFQYERCLTVVIPVCPQHDLWHCNWLTDLHASNNWHNPLVKFDFIYLWKCSLNFTAQWNFIAVWHLLAYAKPAWKITEASKCHAHIVGSFG